MTPTARTLQLPLPPREIMPNARVGWRGKARHVKAYRDGVAIRARARDNHSKPLNSATIRATFYFSVKRRRDRDNLLAWLKPAFDGLVDAGWLTDDSGVTHLPVSVIHDPGYPERVVLTVTGGDNGD